MHSAPASSAAHRPGNQVATNSGGQEDGVDPRHCVVVRGLPKKLDLKELKKIFLKYGPIEKMILEDAITFASGKIVYITFRDSDHAAKAISQMDAKHVFGRKVRVHAQRLPPLTKALAEKMAEETATALRESEERARLAAEYEANKKRMEQNQEENKTAAAAAAEKPPSKFKIAPAGNIRPSSGNFVGSAAGSKQ